ncbi:MAG: aromatic-L-amino-acid decarboxylase [Rhodothermales bacterium]|jgi:aromatic-L-amino-acid decarboxylase
MLELSREAMESLGNLVVDHLVTHRADIRDQPASRVLSRSAADELLDEALPLNGTDPEALVNRLKKDVFANISHVDHPRFFAFVPGPGNFVAAMGAALAAGYNVFAGTWLGGSGAARLEQTVIDWLKEAVGYPPDGGGLFVSGGSMANLTALGAARHAKLGSHDARGVVYFSDQTHSAVERALRVLGLPESQMRRIPADPSRGLDPEQLSNQVRADRAAGLTPFCVVANAGTTNTGAVDPLRAIADICDREDLWFHVDGAYGAAAVFGNRATAALRGLSRADSIALDPHKWLFQPFECGCLLVRDSIALRSAYAIHPDYMVDTRLEDEEINFCEYGVQLSRSFRALSLWMTLKTFGANAVGKAIDHAFDMADHAETVLSGMPGWVLVTPPSMAILTFRFEDGPADSLDAWNAAMVRQLRESGVAMVSSTLLRGNYVIRLCPTNPRTTREDIEVTLGALAQSARDAGYCR